MVPASKMWRGAAVNEPTTRRSHSRWVLLLAVSVAAVRPLLSLPIETLVKSADAIVIGSVQTRLESASGVSFELTVETVISGDLPSLVRIDHKWGSAGPDGAPETVNVGLRGLWFLKRDSASGPWDVLRARAIGQNLFSGLVYPLPGTAAISSLAGSTGASELSESILLALIQSAAATSGQQSPGFVLDALGASDSPNIRSALRGLLGASSGRAKGVGMTALLVRSDDSAVAALSSEWPSLADAPESVEVVQALRSYFRSVTPQAIGSLVQLAQLSSMPAGVQQAAVWALRSIHTQETLPFLASLLDSSDSSLKLAGAIGIAAFANGCPMQSPSNMASMAFLSCPGSRFSNADTKRNFLFNGSTPEEEAAKEAYWKSWWQSNQAALLR